MSNKINKLYITISQPGSFSGLTSFLRNNSALTENEAKKELIKLPAYSLHKSVIRNFKRQKTIVYGIDNTWQIDLVDVSNLKNKKLSQFYNYLFVAIDVFSRYGFIQSMKNKTAKEATKALSIIFEKSKRKPQNIYSDNGKEFLGEFKSYLNKFNINQFFTKSIHKAAIVERLNRTLKEKMYRVFTFTNSKNYVSILNDLISSYNNSYHSSIKMKPSEVTSKNQDIVFKNLYGSYYDNIIHFKFKKGNYVRISVEKSLFEKGYTPNWSLDLYIISKQIPSYPPTYQIKNLDDTELERRFYDQELQLVSDDQFPYDTFKVLKESASSVLIQKLNSENKPSIWINKSELNESKTFNSEIKETQQKEEVRRITRSQTSK